VTSLEDRVLQLHDLLLDVQTSNGMETREENAMHHVIREDGRAKSLRNLQELGKVYVSSIAALVHRMEAL
jgi:hypothetical protein